MSAAGSRVRRTIRWLSGGAGPLKRATDRIEAASRVLAVLVVLAAIPGGFLIASAVRGHLEGVAAAQAGVRHPTNARLLTNVDASSGSPDPTVLLPARVGYATADGHRRTATVRVPAGKRAGSTVRVWVAAGGRLASAPLDRAAIGNDAAGAGVLAAAAIPVLACGVHGVVRLLLDRHRARRWTTGWLAVEPVWAGRQG